MNIPSFTVSLTKGVSILALLAFAFTFTACDKDDDDDNNNNDSNPVTSPVFLVIDEESIDNGNPPNNFTDVDVNDQLAEVGLRKTLQYFKDNIGQVITLYTGQVGDEGWFAPRTIPASWISTGPTSNGTINYLTPGPGLGAPGPGGDRELYLDEIPDVTPLRATGLAMLTGRTVYAVVYDSDISINYSPLKGSLKGDNLGIVSFDVISVVKRTDGSSSDLPRVTIRIRNVTETAVLPKVLFANAPVPQSSSEPFDITPPSPIPAISTVVAP